LSFVIIIIIIIIIIIMAIYGAESADQQNRGGSTFSRLLAQPEQWTGAQPPGHPSLSPLNIAYIGVQ